MNSNRNVAVIAPESMLGAFSVLIQSAPHLHLIASATSLETFRSLVSEVIPDVILIYLVQDNGLFINGESPHEKIERFKTTWPEVHCIIIVKYVSQLGIAVDMGADIALLDGIGAEKLLAAIEGKPAE